MVVQTIADTLTCVEAEAPLKIQGDSVAKVEAYIVIEALVEVEAEVLVYTQAYTFAQVQAKRVTNALTRY